MSQISVDQSLTKARSHMKRGDIRAAENLYKEIDRLSKKLKEITGSKTLDEAEKKVLRKQILEQIIKQKRTIEKRFPNSEPITSPLSFNLNGKSMNNDIAMLNIDTSYRDIIIIDRGQA